MGNEPNALESMRRRRTSTRVVMSWRTCSVSRDRGRARIRDCLEVAALTSATVADRPAQTCQIGTRTDGGAS
jgi:hypothetical protein